MAPVSTTTRRRGRALPMLMAVGGGALLWVRGGLSFSGPAGYSRKQQKSNLHTRSNLKDTLEVKLPEPEEPPPPKEPTPEYRVPYSMHIVAQFPNHKHLHDESGTRKQIEEKITRSFSNLEDMIRHVEVHLQYSDNFHRDVVPGASKLSGGDNKEVQRMLAPYMFKTTVTLANKQTVAMTNAEKHAQPTLAEALDHMVDVVKRSVRHEKEKMIEADRKSKDTVDVTAPLEDSLEEEMAQADSLAEEVEAASDAAMEKMYEKIEAATDKQ